MEETAEHADAPEDEARYVLDENQRLSRSVLWRLQRQFFDRQGAQSWTEGTVPHYITSNPWIAGAYARVVFGWLRDVYADLDRSQPVYVVELGCGSGRFGFLFLNAFLDRLRRSALCDAPVTYVLTDFTDFNLDVLRSHPSLQSFVEDDLLDFARFDAEHDTELALSHSGALLAPGAIANPVAVLANYFFDSLPHDVFYVHDGDLYEGLVTVSTTDTDPDLTDPELISRIELAYDYQPAPANYYDDPAFNRLLDAYRQQLDDTVLTFPNAGLRCIQALRDLSDGRLLLLSGDKGYSHEEALQHRDEPGLIVHGSISLAVNYHALGQYVHCQGGAALHLAHRPANLNVSAFLFGPSPTDYVETRLAYDEAIEKQGPDTFFALKKGAEKNYDAFTLEQLLGYLRLVGWDHNIVLGALPALMAHAQTASEDLLAELHRTIEQVWAAYFPLREPRDLAFHLGILLYEMQYYAGALDFFEHSLRLYGPDPATAFNQALCHFHLGTLNDALLHINQALEADANNADARALNLEIMSALSQENLQSPDDSR